MFVLRKYTPSHHTLRVSYGVSVVSTVTKDTPYLALVGELLGVFCEYLWK